MMQDGEEMDGESKAGRKAAVKGVVGTNSIRGFVCVCALTHSQCKSLSI